MIGDKDLADLARIVGLDIPAEHAKATLANLQRIEQVAQLLNGVEVAPEDELAVWSPGDPAPAA